MANLKLPDSEVELELKGWSERVAELEEKSALGIQIELERRFQSWFELRIELVCERRKTKAYILIAEYSRS